MIGSIPQVRGATPTQRRLRSLQRSDALLRGVFRGRYDYEEYLSLGYAEEGTGGSAGIVRRRYTTNYAYRYQRWLEAQATGEPLVVKMPTDAGATAKAPGEEQTAESVSRLAMRAWQEAHADEELNAVVAECCGRGVSFLVIGYHQEAIRLPEAQEAGKDAQSIVVDVMKDGDVEPAEGQAHAEIAANLKGVVEDPGVQSNPNIGREQIVNVMVRALGHTHEAEKEEKDRKPIRNVRPIRRRVWVRQMRAGEQILWDPSVSDMRDARWMAIRRVWTLAEVKASGIFTDKFKANVKGEGALGSSAVMEGGQAPSASNQSSDARAAQSEEVDEAERVVEWFEVWEARPNMRAGGVCYALSGEFPEEIVSKDDQNPYVDEQGVGLIPGFYPIFDFAPLRSTLPQPERTAGIPLTAPGWVHIKRIQEFNRLRVAAARRHSIGAHQLHPSLRGNNRLLEAFKNGESDIAFFAPSDLLNTDGQMMPAVLTIQFTGDSSEIEKQIAYEESAWVKVQGMPPAHLTGQGQAETATQEQIGVSAGESEMANIVKRMEQRVADVVFGLLGLMRGFYDDEDFIDLVGLESAKFVKAWLDSPHAGDRPQVRFGLRATREEAVAKKQLMEAIQLVRSLVDPLTGEQQYEDAPLVEALFRKLELGKPQPKQMTQKDQLAKLGMQVLQAQKAQAGQGQPSQNVQSQPGPRPSEGAGPTQANMEGGVRRTSAYAA